MTKIYTMEQGQIRTARKSLNFEQFLSSVSAPDKLNPTAYGLAHGYSASVWAFRAIQLRAKAVSGIPLQITNGQGQPLDNHPAAAMIGDVASRLLEQIELGLCIWGVAYLEVVFNGLNRVHSLKWLNPLAVSPVKTPLGITTFHYSPSYGGPQVAFTPDDLVYLQTINPLDDLGGLSPLEVALAAVNVDRDTIRYAQAFFSNGARLDGLLTVPDANDAQIDAIEAKWKRVFRGVKNAFRTLVIGAEGISYTPVTPPPKDVVLAEIKAEQRRDICAAIGVPPALVGAWEASNYATAQQQRKSFYTETVLPELDFLEDELNRQFMARFFPGALVQFNLADIEALREDESERNTAISTAYNSGWMTLNEARERAGLPPLPNGDTVLNAAPAAAEPAVSAELPFPFNGESYP